MTDQNIDNESKFLINALSYLTNKGAKCGFNLNNYNFKKNLEEIIKNPNSNYVDNVHLFNEIPKLIKQKEDLNNDIQSLNTQIKGLETAKTNLETEKSKKENEIKDLGIEIEKFETIKKTLELEINGSNDPNDNEEKMFGLEKIRNDLYEKIYGKDFKNLSENEIKNLNEISEKINDNKDQNTNDIDKRGLIKRLKSLNDEIIKMIKKDSIVKTLSEFRRDAKDNNRFYYVYLFLMIVVIGYSSHHAYLYGDQIIKNITAIKDKNSRDYFGMFLMKIPFSLMIITFISGGFIFINKLLVIIERINNQLRNVSQISVIASQIDKRAFDLYHKKTDDELKMAVEKKEESALFYNLIAEYLINLSKNELELKEKKGNQLKMLKELANIINQVNTKSKE